MRKSERPINILITRLGDAGDIALASPLLHAIQNTYPNATIHWLSEPANTPLLETLPHIKKVISWNSLHWQHLKLNRDIRGIWYELARIRRILKAGNYEIALDLQGSTTTGFFTLLTGAKFRIGLDSRGGSNWFMTKTISRNTGDRSQIGSQYRYFADQLGYHNPRWETTIPLSEEAVIGCQNILSPLTQGQHYAVICPFSDKKERNWNDAHWQQLTLRIRGHYQLRTVILGDNEDREHAEELAKSCGAINLCGKTNLLENCAAIADAEILIGVDTGLTHIGHALNTPVVALFGASSPYSFTEYQASSIIYLDRFCSPCDNNPTCKGQFECMMEITPDRVLTEIKNLARTGAILAAPTKIQQQKAQN